MSIIVCCWHAALCGRHSQLHSIARRSRLPYSMMRKKKQDKKEQFFNQMYKSVIASYWTDRLTTLSHIVQKTVTKSRALPRSYHVRVLLGEQTTAKPFTWHISAGSVAGFTLYNKKEGKCVRYNADELSIFCCQGNIYINGHLCIADNIAIEVSGPHILFKQKPYRGTFIVQRDNDKIYLINSIDLSSYLESVVRSESWPGWPLEVNKAFAIASRSYVMDRMYGARKKSLPYDIKDTNEHQRYNLYGMHDSAIIKKAVADTMGLVLTYNNRPILAMFDSCCGGVIPAHIEDVDFKKVPYLARTYACTFCKACSAYSWKNVYDVAVIHRLLNTIVTINMVKHIRVSKKDASGIAQEITIWDRDATTTISGKELYSLLHDVKSFCFSVAKKGKKVIISGYGLGHHLGICQWGARQMVREGFSYDQILQFYYPGTTIMRMV